MLEALVNSQDDFVQLLLDNTVKLRGFLKTETLRQLYQKVRSYTTAPTLHTLHRHTATITTTLKPKGPIISLSIFHCACAHAGTLTLLSLIHI